jgi:hypothetical protein
VNCVPSRADWFCREVVSPKESGGVGDVHRAPKGKRGGRRLSRADQPAPVNWAQRKSLSQHPRLDRGASHPPPRTIRRESPGQRVAGSWLGAIAAIALAVGCLGGIAALDDPKTRSIGPSSTALAASTTVSTVAALTWTTAPPSSTEEPARTLRTVPPSGYARHYRIGARCRDGWRSDATGSGAYSWHGEVAEWLYADDRIVHDTKTGRELGTVRSVGTFAGRALQRQAHYSLSLDEVEDACGRTFTRWKRERLTDMRDRNRDQFVFYCQLNSLR